jgi:hypothetical protein
MFWCKEDDKFRMNHNENMREHRVGCKECRYIGQGEFQYCETGKILLVLAQAFNDGRAFESQGTGESG